MSKLTGVQVPPVHALQQVVKSLLGFSLGVIERGELRCEIQNEVVEQLGWVAGTEKDHNRTWFTAKIEYDSKRTRWLYIYPHHGPKNPRLRVGTLVKQPGKRKSRFRVPLRGTFNKSEMTDRHAELVIGGAVRIQVPDYFTVKRLPMVSAVENLGHVGWREGALLELQSRFSKACPKLAYQTVVILSAVAVEFMEEER